MMMKGKCDETYGNCKRTCGMCGKCKDKGGFQLTGLRVQSHTALFHQICFTGILFKYISTK